LTYRIHIILARVAEVISREDRHVPALDLSFVRWRVAERYADRGQPSIDPVVFFRFQLIVFSDGIGSER
jgi:hypothetical protein